MPLFCDIVFSSVHFYCYQHAGLDAQPRPQRIRKRSFGDKDLIAKLAPIIAPVKPPDVAGARTPAQSSCQVDGAMQPKVTPERVEFDIDSEWEESELEQTSHNLNASFAAALSDDNSDSE